MIELTRLTATSVQVVVTGIPVQPEAADFHVLGDHRLDFTRPGLPDDLVHLDVVTPGGTTFGESANLVDGGFERVLEVGGDASAAGPWVIRVRPFHEQRLLDEATITIGPEGEDTAD
jgi:hypothetical protein